MKEHYYYYLKMVTRATAKVLRSNTVLDGGCLTDYHQANQQARGYK
jgi:hypothetical protein